MESNFVNTVPKFSTPVYHASQNDNGRVFRSSLYDESVAYTLAGTENIRLRYMKPSGKVSSIAVTNTSSNYVDITVPSSMTDEAGLVYCKLRIDGIGAKAILLNVEKGV